MGLSVWHVVVVLMVVLILFGAGKLPQVMGDVAKGIKNFKSGMADEDDKSQPTAQLAQQSSAVAPDAANSDGTRPLDQAASGGKS